ncbi:MAG: bifunctional hydroxymethylpyrimidine kinase/phosphomethylpyrimidine kinase [Thermodesulfovibrionales bacterium]|nr:bifunctional hydroxymethylpyrimidine kinase/phosphomethylpyrimidine kinase [Thermodesulfovibrionales bacterium]
MRRVLRDTDSGAGAEEKKDMKTVLTIAGSDPTGGAGLQADLKVFRAFGVYGISVVAAITAQNTQGVNAIFSVEKIAIKNQFETLLSDIRPDAVKIGMLYRIDAVEIVSDLIRKYSLQNVVIDPVTVSSSGTSLVDEGTLDAIKGKLFPLAKIITPNMYEATVLTGVAIENREGMEEAAAILKQTGTDVVLITGGHLEGIALDLYYDGVFHRLESEKLPGEFHGTGCIFSSAIAALLALEYAPLETARKAKEFVKNAIKKAYYPGKGMGILHI